MANYLQQQAGFPIAGATIDDFQLPISSITDQPQFFFAGGVIAPSSGIYLLTPAPPGGLSSLGPRLTTYG